MTLTFDEFQKRRAPDRLRRRILAQQDAVMQVRISQEIQAVTTHPGWQLYLAHLETLTQRGQAGVTAAKDAAITHSDTAQREANRMDALRLTGYLQGLKDATDLVPELIRRGDRASRDLLTPSEPVGTNT